MRRPLAAVAALLVALLCVGFELSQWAPRPSVLATASDDEACLITDINAARVAAHVPTLPVDPALVDYDEQHSAAMAAAGTIFHSGGSPTQQEPVGNEFRDAIPEPYRSEALVIGENVGEATGGCEVMNQAYVNSPPHFANIIDSRWTAMAVGVAYDVTGTLYSTESFVDMPAPPALPPSPRIVVAPKLSPKPPAPSPLPAKPSPSHLAPVAAATPLVDSPSPSVAPTPSVSPTATRTPLTAPEKTSGLLILGTLLSTVGLGSLVASLIVLARKLLRGRKAGEP